MEDANRSLEEQIRKLCDRTSDSMDRRILNDLTGKLKKREPFQPTSTPAGVWRIIMNSRRIKLAAAAVIALALLLPVSYAAVEAVVKYFTISEDRVSFPEVQEPNLMVGGMASRSISVGGTSIASEDEARTCLAEFRQLYSEGKAREIEPGTWQVTLANGELFNYKGDPERMTAEFTDQDKEQMKKEFDEINALRSAGKGDRTFLRETALQGMTVRVYEVHYTLSSGKTVTVEEVVTPDGSLVGMGGGL
jgi:hypothetical protein